MTQLESKLSYHFRNPSLLEEALTHSSLGHERGQHLPHNERLEFLGDAVLELAITEHLFLENPGANEGRLTKIRAHLANRTALKEIAELLELGRHLRFGEAEAAHGGRQRASNLANAVEAIIGAIFLDGGYDSAREFVVRHIRPRLTQISSNPEPENAKGILQEKAHAMKKTVQYRIISEKGPAHQKHFEAMVEIDGQNMGSGSGATKKEAETRAATVALDALRAVEHVSAGR